MKYVSIILSGAAVFMMQHPAQADPSLMAMAKANGLAEIIVKAEPCGYEVDQGKLEAYYAANELDTPEILTFIMNTTQLAGLSDDKPSASECTISKATAKKLDLLVP